MPTTSVVLVVAVFTACATVVFPSSAADVGATAITIVSITLAALALNQTQPTDAGAATSGPGRPAVVFPRSSKKALILTGVAIAVGCTAPVFNHQASASGSVGELVTLVGAACAATLAGLELLHGVARNHVSPPAPSSETSTRNQSVPVAEWYHGGTALESLTTESLCREWKLSFLALRATTDALAHARVVEDRRRYLDELARRDPAGFQRWISSDTYPVAGHPENFIAGGSSHPPPPVGPGQGAP